MIFIYFYYLFLIFLCSKKPYSMCVIRLWDISMVFLGHEGFCIIGIHKQEFKISDSFLQQIMLQIQVQLLVVSTLQFSPLNIYALFFCAEEHVSGIVLQIFVCMMWISLKPKIYLEPVCPLFLALTPPKQGLFQSKRGSVAFIQGGNLIFEPAFRFQLAPPLKKNQQGASGDHPQGTWVKGLALIHGKKERLSSSNHYFSRDM